VSHKLGTMEVYDKHDHKYITVVLGPDETFKSGLVRAKQTLGKVHDDLETVTIHIHRNA
jgi:hypothetical protein